MLSSPGKKRARESTTLIDLVGEGNSSSRSSTNLTTTSSTVVEHPPLPLHTVHPPVLVNFHNTNSNTNALSSSSIPSSGTLIQHTDSLTLIQQRSSSSISSSSTASSLALSKTPRVQTILPSSQQSSVSSTPSFSSSYVHSLSTPVQTYIPVPTGVSSSSSSLLLSSAEPSLSSSSSSSSLSASMLNSSSLNASNLNVSQLASTTGGRVCTISSHARLEALVKQTELLRKLDTDMHEAIKAKMQEQINRLVSQVEELTHALDTAREWSIESRTVNGTTTNDTTTTTHSSRSSLSSSSAPLPSTGSNNSVPELQQHLQALTKDNTHLRNLLEENQRNYSAMLNKYETNWNHTQTELNQAQQRIGELERMQEHPTASLLDDQYLSSSVTSDPSAGRIAKLESEISKVREEVRSYQRKERAMQDEIKKLTVNKTNELLLQEQIHALQTKLNRTEPLAIEMVTYRTRFESMVKTLQQWETEIFQPLLQSTQVITNNNENLSKKEEKKSSLTGTVIRTKENNNLGSSGYAFSSTGSTNGQPSNAQDFQATLATLFNLSAEQASKSWTKDEEESYVQQFIQRAKDNIGTVSSIIAELQSSQQLLITSITENQTKLSSSNKHYEELSQRYHTVMHQLSDAQKIRNDYDMDNKRLQLKIDTLQANQDRLQALINNYEAEDRTTIALRIASEAHNNLITVVAAGTTTGSSGSSSTATATTNANQSKPTKALITAASEASTKARDAMFAAQAETQSIKQRCKTLESILQIYQTSLTNVLNLFSTYSNPAIVQTLENRIKLADNEIDALRSELMVVYSSTPKVSSSSLLASSLSTYYPPPKTDSFEAEPSGLSTWNNGTPVYDNNPNSTSSGTHGGSRYRILHLVANPTAHALKEAEQKQKLFLDNCKTEIGKLREIIQHHNQQINSLTIENEKLKHQMMIQMTNSMDSTSKTTMINTNNENMITSAFNLDTASSSSSGTGTASSSSSAFNTSTFQIRSAALDNDTSTITNNSNNSSNNNAADFDKFRERFKTMFKVQIELFRDIVYRLTGWLITMPFSNATSNIPRDIILKSVYAENENDYLHFRFHDDTLELIDTPFVASLPPGAFAFLSMTKDFPPFLAAVITDLSSKQTISNTIGT